MKIITDEAVWTAPCCLYPSSRNDADTRRVLVATGGEAIARFGLRILGVDTPESKRQYTKDSQPDELRDLEVEVGGLVSEAVDGWIAERSGHPLVTMPLPEGDLIFDFILSYRGDDKYGGRVLGDLIAPDVAEGEASLQTFLIRGGLAREYDGGNKPAWTRDELETIRTNALAYLGRPASQMESE